jgi:hypothetical protein
MPASTSWADVRRVESWAGEVRVNLIRLVALVAFYGYHLLNVYLYRDDAEAGGPFHASATALALSWGIMVLVLHFVLSRRVMPPWLAYASVTWDIVLVTILVAAAGGPRSPLVLLYFLVVATAPLRLSLRLVYLATLGCVVAYVLLLGWYVFLVVGREAYYTDTALRIPRTQQVIFVLVLAGVGLLAGQAIRQTRRLADRLRAVSPEGER